jgi:hypothetical protein
MEWTEIPHDPSHLEVPSGASKTISGPMVCLAQTAYLSCIDTNIESKWNDVRFQMTHVTYEFHRVHRVWFLSLWYIWRKLCTYLVSRLALSSKGPKQASIWALSSYHQVVQNDFWTYGTSSANLHLSCVKISTIFERTETSFHLSLVIVPSGVPKRFLNLWYI